MTLYVYPPELSDALLSLGLVPTPDTPPALVREQVDDLYKIELRALRGLLLAGEFERPAYVERIIELRRKYWMLTLPLAAWEKICSVTP